ncbi:MAG: hypothetical protein E6556_21515, partial [Pantoea sp.]|nr:hypothetical protein [Pantoea sp.]
GYNLMSLAMEKVEKRLTDLSSALAHIYPGITLTKVPFCQTSRIRAAFRSVEQKSGNKINFLHREVKPRAAFSRQNF